MRRLKFNNKKKVKTISSETIRNGISNTSNLTINPNEEAQKNESSDISTTTTQINYDAVYYELLNLFTANAQIQCVLGNEFSDLEKILQSVQSLLANQSKF